MTKTANLIKPTLATQSKSAAALAFADVPKVASTSQTGPEKRAFSAPEGYRRLTINLREDLHKKLRLVAVEKDCTATEIIERLLIQELNKNN